MTLQAAELPILMYCKEGWVKRPGLVAAIPFCQEPWEAIFCHALHLACGSCAQDLLSQWVLGCR